ncbi:MAG TPA: hypothetical protein PLL78_00250 [Fimbriimonadaceae bacterium]|nr:hypothetical protein [Fimbriimonadaceae bacterium]HRJ95091.1 hypothetical protein [Fimbriimonadaceae bacterium]
MFLVATLGAVGSAHGLLVPIIPFPPTNMETFDTMPPGTYAGFAGMGGFAGFSRVPAVNAMQVGGGPILPPLSPPNAMYGRGTDVLLRFQAPRRRFGGWFRVANSGVVVTQATFIFRNSASIIVGIAVVPINTASWQWYGWFSTLAFHSVEIQGNGTSPGYVGMDHLLLAP